MKKSDLKKMWFFIIFLLITFLVFLYIYNHRQGYELNYVLNNYSVSEKYNIEKGYYDLSMTKDNNTYEIILDKDYTPKRQIIKEITELNEDNKKCLKLNEDLIKYPICKENNEYVSYYYNKSIETNDFENFNNIKIYDLNNKTYLVWNYTGYYEINNNKKNMINLFEQDTYTPYLVIPVNNNLFIANYDNEYSFTDYYLVYPKKGNAKKFSLDKEIYLDSYILGTYQNSVYLVDKKNIQEYEINTIKNKVYETGGKILNKGEWNKIDINTLINNKNSFTENNNFYYSIDNSNLYYNEDNIKVKIMENVTYIAYQDSNDVYFISNDILYYYNHENGIKVLMKYSEWQFNYQNSVFVF
jgi:hypothetical protein